MSLCGGVGWWGLHSHFHVQPNYSVEVVLHCSLGFDKKGRLRINRLEEVIDWNTLVNDYLLVEVLRSIRTYWPEYSGQ